METADTHIHPVILFDGVCNLCNGAVQWVIKRDKKNTFRFASLQSEFGQKFLEQKQIPMATAMKSFIFWESDQVFTSSTAALRVVRRLGGGWPVLYGFSVIPAFLRNAVYDLVSRNRYRWFGKQETCRLPTPALQERFYQ